MRGCLQWLRTASDEGQRQCCLDNVSGIVPAVRSKKSGGLVKNRHRWSAERRACRSHGTRHLSRCQTKTLRLTGAPSLAREKENEGGAPRLTTSGADESRLDDR